MTAKLNDLIKEYLKVLFDPFTNPNLKYWILKDIMDDAKIELAKIQLEENQK